MIHFEPRRSVWVGVCVGGGGGEVFGLIFAGYVSLASQNTYTIFVYSVVIL